MSQRWSTYRHVVERVAELLGRGASIHELEEKRRERMKKSPEIAAYKGELLQRIEYAADGALAYVHIPWAEIEKYSHSYNPGALVVEELRMIEGVKVAVARATATFTPSIMRSSSTTRAPGL